MKKSKKHMNKGSQQDNQAENNASNNPQSETVNSEATESTVATDAADNTDASASNDLSELEKLKLAVTQKEQEVEKEKKEYLFLMAEFDNFRKRTLRERTELIKSAGEKVLKGLLPIVDDFERGLNAMKDAADAETVKEGMQLIYNKVIKYLADNGVTEMKSTGAAFDTELHEAVAMIPATDDAEKGMVKETVTKGYMLNDKVLRHAKVVVAQ
jgi:molecular chaperone GrpE